MNIKRISSFEPQVINMIQELDRANLALYPDGPNYLESPESLEEQGSLMIGAFDGEELIAMGGVLWCDDYAEVKRVFVGKKWRGKGLSKLIMNELEKRCLEAGFFCLRLETGTLQEPAIRLYKSLGYNEISAFGKYKEHELSLFFEKELRKRI